MDENTVVIRIVSTLAGLFNINISVDRLLGDVMNSDDSDENDDSDEGEDLEAGGEQIDWGHSPTYKKWERADRPYHPGDRRRRR
jgi:hypothetical protein